MNAKRIQCVNDIIEIHLKKLKKWHKVEKCRTCDCLQGALTQFQIDGADKIREKVKDLIVSKDEMHGCLGCDPCQPAEVFSSYIKANQNLLRYNILAIPQ